MTVFRFALTATAASFLACAGSAANDALNAGSAPGNFTEVAGSAAMGVAISRARTALPEFLRQAGNPRAGFHAFAIKFGVPTPQGNEYVWANILAVDIGHVHAKVDADVRWTDTIKNGDTVMVENKDIVDWLYVMHGKMQGNATLCAIQHDQPSQQRAAMIRNVGLDCSWLKEANKSVRPEVMP